MNKINLNIESLKNLLKKKVSEGFLEHTILVELKHEDVMYDMAKYMAKLILCNQESKMETKGDSLFVCDETNISPISKSTPCGACPSCKKIESNNHPDVLQLFPTFSGVKENATPSSLLLNWSKYSLETEAFGLSNWAEYLNNSGKNPNITVAQVDYVLNQLQVKSYESRARVVLAFYPEYLFLNGNKMLKAIEEPNPDNYFIFFSITPNQIIETILSRCFKYSLLDESVYSIHQMESFTKQLDSNSDLRKTYGLFMDSIQSKHYHHLDISVEQLSLLSRNDMLSFVQSIEYFIVNQNYSYCPLSIPQNQWADVSNIIQKSLYAIKRNANVQMILNHIALKLMVLLNP